MNAIMVSEIHYAKKTIQEMERRLQSAIRRGKKHQVQRYSKRVESNTAKLTALILAQP